MTSLKWILPLVLILIIGFFLFKPTAPVNNVLPEESKVINQPAELEKTMPEKATGEIDDLVGSLFIDLENEEISFGDEAEDLELFDLDAQAINNLGQSYDENEF